MRKKEKDNMDDFEIGIWNRPCGWEITDATEYEDDDGNELEFIEHRFVVKCLVDEHDGVSTWEEGDCDDFNEPVIFDTYLAACKYVQKQIADRQNCWQHCADAIQEEIDRTLRNAAKEMKRIEKR